MFYLAQGPLHAEQGGEAAAEPQVSSFKAGRVGQGTGATPPLDLLHLEAGSQ